MKVSKKLFEKIKNIKKESIKEIERLLDENDGFIINNKVVSNTIVINQTNNSSRYYDAHVSQVYFQDEENGIRDIYLEVSYHCEDDEPDVITIDNVEVGSLPYLVGLLEDITK